VTLPDPEGLPAGPRDEQAVSVRRLGGVQVVAAEGTVDLHTVPRLADAVAAALTQRPAKLVIDLTEVGFPAAAGLHVLLDAQHEAGDSTQLRVVATGTARRSISLTAQDEVPAIYPTLAEAVRS
jgi:anti-sigma B factor antagonist